MNILITGAPGVGKTTVMENLAGLLTRPAGFVTSEVRESGRRTGFVIRTFDGKRACLARRGKGEGPRVGSYTVSLQGLESIGVGSIEAGISKAGVILIDEIGKMEAKSSAFRKAVLRALDSRSDVVATLGISTQPFLSHIRNRPDIRLVEVTRSNREELPARIAAMLEGGLE